jgi:hypothetical protein
VSSESKPAVALRHLSSLAASYLFVEDHRPAGEGGARGPCRRTKGGGKEIDRAVEKVAGASASLYLAEGLGWQMRRAVRVIMGLPKRKA